MPYRRAHGPVRGQPRSRSCACRPRGHGCHRSSAGQNDRLQATSSASGSPSQGRPSGAGERHRVPFRSGTIPVAVERPGRSGANVKPNTSLATPGSRPLAGAAATLQTGIGPCPRVPPARTAAPPTVGSRPCRSVELLDIEPGRRSRSPMRSDGRQRPRGSRSRVAGPDPISRTVEPPHRRHEHARLGHDQVNRPWIGGPSFLMPTGSQASGSVVRCGPAESVRQRQV